MTEKKNVIRRIQPSFDSEQKVPNHKLPYFDLEPDDCLQYLPILLVNTDQGELLKSQQRLSLLGIKNLGLSQPRKLANIVTPNRFRMVVLSFPQQIDPDTAIGYISSWLGRIESGLSTGPNYSQTVAILLPHDGNGLVEQINNNFKEKESLLQTYPHISLGITHSGFTPK